MISAFAGLSRAMAAAAPLPPPPPRPPSRRRRSAKQAKKRTWRFPSGACAQIRSFKKRWHGTVHIVFRRGPRAKRWVRGQRGYKDFRVAQRVAARGR